MFASEARKRNSPSIQGLKKLTPLPPTLMTHLDEKEIPPHPIFPDPKYYMSAT